MREEREVRVVEGDAGDIRERLEDVVEEDDVEVLAKDGAAIEMRDTDDEDLERAAANLGINLSRNESASVEDLA